MALFSRRKKTDDPASRAAEAPAPPLPETPIVPTPEVTSAPAEDVPAVAISVQAFRGVGAAAGPTVTVPESEASPDPVADVPAQAAADRKLPLAPLLPPAATESMPGVPDNALLRAALAELGEKPTNVQMLGVLRQALQGQLFIRVQGDPSTQAPGSPLAVGVIREGERSFMLAFSSLIALRDSVQRETNPQATAAAAQPVTDLLKQVVAGGFAGLIIDNAEPVHRAVFPAEVLKQALEHADPAMTLKSILTAPHTEESPGRLAQALVRTPAWVAVGSAQEGGQAGIAEARLPDGRRFLQVFSHPLEIVALGRSERPLPFAPEQLKRVLAENTDLAGVLVDFAGPSMILPRPMLIAALEEAGVQATGSEA